MDSRGGQSLISTEFHVLTIRGIQVDGRCEIGERGRLAHELLTTRTTTRLETRNKREHLDCETKRGNLDTRAASSSSTSLCNFSTPPSSPLIPRLPQLAPIVAYGGQDASPRRDILGSWNGRVAAPVQTGAASLSFSLLRTSLLRRCMCDQLVLRIVLNTRNNLWTGHNDDDWNIYSARYTPGAHLYTMESRRATRYRPPVGRQGQGLLLWFWTESS